MWKVLSVFAALLTAGAAIFSYLNKEAFEQERNLAATAVSNLKEIKDQLADVKGEQVKYTAKNTAMVDRRDKARIARDEEKDKLAQKKQEVEAVDQSITDLENEVAAAKEKIAEIGTIKELVALVDQLQTDLFTAKNGIATLEQKLDSSTDREVETADTIQDYKNLEYRQRNGQMVSINASIDSVFNSWGFVILGAGDSQGVVSRTKLDVKRGEDKIAELVVTNLEKNRSICDIVPGSMEPGQMLRPGDRVSVSADSLPKPKAEIDPNAPVVPTIPGAPLPPVAPPPPSGDPDDPFADFTTPSTPSTPATPATPPADPEPAPEKPADPDDPFSDL